MSTPSVDLLYIYTSSSTAFANISASASCLSALTADVSCYANLGSAVTDTTTWSSSALGFICANNCTTALSAYVANVDSVCGATATYNISGTIQTAADLGREMQWRQSTTCLTDPSSGEYCNTYFQEALANSSTGVSCSTCYLTYMESIVNSEWGQALISNSEFESQVSSCSATGYSATYTATSSSSTSTATPTVTSGDRCNKTDPSVALYTVLANDSCIDISASQNVSTGSLTSLNGLDQGCSYLSTGEKLCLPTTCDVYLVKTNDTCTSIISSFSSGITNADLASWNSNINSQCSNLAALVGTYICISPPGSPMPLYLPPAATAVAVPTNAVGTTNVDCGYWYTIIANDTCGSIEAAFGITNATFYFLNPQIAPDCGNLWLGNSYCVEAVGNVATYSGYSTVAASLANYTSLPSTINRNATATANRTTTHFFYSWPTPTTTTLAAVNASVYSALATYTLCLDVEEEYNITETGPTQDMYDDTDWINEYDRVCDVDPNDLPTVPFNSSIVYTAPATVAATTTSGTGTGTAILAIPAPVRPLEDAAPYTGIAEAAPITAARTATRQDSSALALRLRQLRALRVPPRSWSRPTVLAGARLGIRAPGRHLAPVAPSTGTVALRPISARHIVIPRASSALAARPRRRQAQKARQRSTFPQMGLAAARRDTLVPTLQEDPPGRILLGARTSKEYAPSSFLLRGQSSSETLSPERTPPGGLDSFVHLSFPPATGRIDVSIADADVRGNYLVDQLASGSTLPPSAANLRTSGRRETPTE
ncbi:hypothetical protein V499_00778 [Pseudogymnoascus sp. VKM F-103]|nr:hypothetical protein V499_00778 [Pseudogymnoascus sp. VKM F-103]